QSYQRRLASAMRLAATSSLVDEPPEIHDLPTVLAWLDDDERALLVLSYAQEYSHREIADITGMPIGTVKSKLARAKAKVLERMEPESRGRERLDAEEVRHG